jgi:outer membrane lipoprotein-sorting protein
MQMKTLLQRLALIWLSAFSLAVIAADDASLAAITAQIEQHATIRADFVQTKQMLALKRPLISSGKLLYSRDHGVLWQIQQPYRISYVLGEDKIIEIGADGVRKQRNLQDLPGMAQVGRIFRAILGGNTASLRSYFSVSGQGNREKWSIQLSPNQAQIKQFLSGLQLEGGEFLDRMRINETSGDSTLIVFSHTESIAEPDSAELRLFSGKP